MKVCASFDAEQTQTGHVEVGIGHGEFVGIVRSAYRDTDLHNHCPYSLVNARMNQPVSYGYIPPFRITLHQKSVNFEFGGRSFIGPIGQQKSGANDNLDAQHSPTVVGSLPVVPGYYDVTIADVFFGRHVTRNAQGQIDYRTENDI
uniref:Uncharacterized protein n=1 Tax=Romanomermis culicivorax TaxID=13658 RepID=A0A915JXW7_ROMCU